MNRRSLGATLSFALWAACASAPERSAIDPGLASPRQTATTDARKPPPAPEREVETQVAVVDPAVLGVLASRGFSLGRVVAGSEALTAAELSRSTGLKSVFDVLAKDVRETAASNPPARVTTIDGFRLFDTRWLGSEEVSFDLTGVFNRLDRRAFDAGTCGEIRFIYRMRYDTKRAGGTVTSRLPMTVNVVFKIADDEGCRAVARAWQSPKGVAGAALADWMVADGPLGPAMRKRYRLKSVETNLQTLRLQSSVQPTMAGHVEYGLHVFHPVDEARTAFAPAPMENMPDVRALSRDRDLRARLLAHLRKPEVLRDLDQGTLTLPDEFLTRHAKSFSPRGLSRLANRPFRQIFDEADFAGLDASAYRTIGSPKALLRRLDGASCTGCHQSRSIAGFHHAGNDRDDAPVWGALLRGLSSHLGADLERRRAYVSKVAAGEAPDEARPIAERQGVGRGYGAPCGLGDAGFASWTCADGFRCVKLEDPDVGTCLADAGVGAPCEYGSIKPNAAPVRDFVEAWKQPSCDRGLSCDKNISGFPLGTCGAACDDGAPGATCGDFLEVDGFQNCLRLNLRWEDCAAKHVLRTGLRTCDTEHPCRQDYVCARTRTAGVGACVPPYFVYPLRLDGYPR